MKKIKTKMKVLYWKLFRRPQYKVYIEWVDCKKKLDKAVRLHEKVSHLRRDFYLKTCSLDWVLKSWK